MMLVDFWATWCGSCIVEFADLQNTSRMYGARDYSVVTISANMPDEKRACALSAEAACDEPQLSLRFAGYRLAADGI